MTLWIGSKGWIAARQLSNLSLEVLTKLLRLPLAADVRQRVRVTEPFVA